MTSAWISGGPSGEKLGAGLSAPPSTHEVNNNKVSDKSVARMRLVSGHGEPDLIHGPSEGNTRARVRRNRAGHGLGDHLRRSERHLLRARAHLRGPQWEAVRTRRPRS